MEPPSIAHTRESTLDLFEVSATVAHPLAHSSGRWSFLRKLVAISRFGCSPTSNRKRVVSSYTVEP